MPKAYWVTLYRSISDADKLAAYAKLSGPAVTPLGARYIARGTAVATFEAGLKERTVISEFDSVELAKAAHDSAGYQEAMRALDNGAVRDVRIVEGLEDQGAGLAGAKAFWVSAYRSISNPDAVAAYGKIAGPAIQGAGGRFLARGEAAAVFEAGIKQRTVVIAFDSVEAAVACHDGAAYQEALKVFNNAAERDFRIVEAL